MEGVQTVVAAARPDDPAEEARVLAQVQHALFARPSGPPTVGRYTLVRTLGSGAFGAVYEGFDPELERPVAIKLVRRAAIAAGDPDARMLREAKLLARLSHPNVVAVHDVGTTQVDPSPARAESPQIYIVMELVEGTTLREWLKVRPRSQAEILDALMAAGRGLAAAHARGIVHRDFKPDNVLVGSDGRVRVSDFGLARVSTGLPSVEVDSQPSEQTGEVVEDVHVTATGVLVGTPLYMAPEQHVGDVGDARSDQYAFCVAAWEALSGRRPFHGTLAEIVKAKHTRRASRPPPGIGRGLWRVLVRGLCPDPAGRHADLDALLTALDRARRRPRRLAAMGGLLVAGLGMAAWWSRPGVPEPAGCESEEAIAEALWPRARREAVAGALEGSSFSRGGPPITEALLGWVQRWSAEKRAVCVASRSPAQGEAGTLVARDACLDHQGREFGVVVELLAAGEPAALQGAPYRVASQPPLEPCLADNPVSVPASSARHASVRLEIEAAALLVDVGSIVEATARLEPALARARDEGADALYARALAVRNRIHSHRGRYEQAAADIAAALPIAERAGDQIYAAQLAVTQVLVVGLLQDRVDAGRALVDAARARIEGASMATTLEPRLVLIEGRLDVRAGDYSAARARFEDVRRMVSARWGERHPLLAAVENNLGVTYEREGDLSRAEAHYRVAVSMVETIAGEDHPDVGSTLLNLANMQWMRQDLAGTEASARRAIDLLRRSAGPETMLPKALHALAGVLEQSDRCDEALEANRRALELVRAHRSPHHREISVALVQLARTGIACDRAEPALAHLVAARDILRRANAPRFLVAKTYFNEGWAYRELGRFDEAVTAHEQAIALVQSEHGRDHIDVAFNLTQLARDHRAAGDPEAARSAAEEALAIHERNHSPPAVVAEAALVLASVLRDIDPARTRSLATQALEALADSPDGADERAQLRTLLDELDRP